MQQRVQDVIAMYHRHKLVASGTRVIQADLTDSRITDDLLRTLLPDWVIHCAALMNVDRCEEFPLDAYRVNVEMTRNLARISYQIGAGLVYISTDSVFGGERGNYSEEDVPAPVNMYAKSKLEGEKAVQDELERHLIVRTNIYGWNMQKKQSLAEWILGRLEAGQQVPGFCDVVFTPILVNDLCEIILDMLERQLTGWYNVAGSQPCSKYQFALLLGDVFNQERRLVQSVSIEDSFLKAPRPKNTSLRTGKVSRALGRAMPDVKSGLLHFKWLRDSGFVTKLKVCSGD